MSSLVTSAHLQKADGPALCSPRVCGEPGLPPPAPDAPVHPDHPVHRSPHYFYRGMLAITCDILCHHAPAGAQCLLSIVVPQELSGEHIEVLPA